MSRRAEIALSGVLLVLALTLMVIRLLQQDWAWAVLWALGAVLVVVELRRRLGEDPKSR